MQKISTHLTYWESNNCLCYMECHDVLALREGKCKSCQEGWVINLHILVSAGSSHKPATANPGCSVVHKGWIQSCRQCCSKARISHFHHSCFIKRSGTYLSRNGIMYGRSFIIITSCLTTALMEESHQQLCCTENHSCVHCKTQTISETND